MHPQSLRSYRLTQHALRSRFCQYNRDQCPRDAQGFPGWTLWIGAPPEYLDQIVSVASCHRQSADVEYLTTQYILHSTARLLSLGQDFGNCCSSPRLGEWRSEIAREGWVEIVGFSAAQQADKSELKSAPWKWRSFADCAAHWTRR